MLTLLRGVRPEEDGVMNALEWELISDNTWRAKAIGGWLVRHDQPVAIDMGQDRGGIHDGYDWQSTMCFVPDVGHNWGSQDDKQ